MINEEIAGGLISALSRGESLENAMMTFYNAGYKKEEIEDSAKEVYNQVGPKIMGVKGNLQDTLNDIAVKAGVPLTPPEQSAANAQNVNNIQDKLVLQTADGKKPEQPAVQKTEPQPTAPATPSTPPEGYQNPNEISNKIEEAIKGLRPVNIPSRIEIVHKNIDVQQQPVVQHISDYSAPQKSVSKSVTYVLIAILIILLILLGAVFLFKDDLIKLFNDLGIA